MAFGFATGHTVGTHVVVEEEEEEAISNTLCRIWADACEEARNSIAIVDLLCCIEDAVVVVECWVGVLPFLGTTREALGLETGDDQVEWVGCEVGDGSAS